MLDVTLILFGWVGKGVDQIMFLLVFFLLLTSFVVSLLSLYLVFISSVITLLVVLVTTSCSFLVFVYCTLNSVCAHEVLL